MNPGKPRSNLTCPKIDATGDGEWIYTLMVRALDRAGSQAVLTENIYVTLSEAQPVVRFSKTMAQVGRKGAFGHWCAPPIRTESPLRRPAACSISPWNRAGGAQRLRQTALYHRRPGLSAGSPCPSLPASGKLSAVATLETLDGKPMKHPAKSQPAVMIVGGAQGETVLDNRELELYTANTILSPGEKAKVFALLPADWGKAESGTIWETISGRKDL